MGKGAVLPEHSGDQPRGCASCARWPSWGDLRPDQTANKTLAPQWQMHRSPYRLLHALVPYIGPPSHTLRRIWPVFLAILAESIAVKFLGEFHAIDFDPTNVTRDAFRLTSFVVSLLLAQRVGRTYERWWNARAGFAGIGNGVTTIVRQAAVWSDDPVLLEQFQRWALAWHFSVLQLVTGKTQTTDPRVMALLGEDEAAIYSATNKPRLLCGAMLGVLATRAGFTEQRLQIMEGCIEAVTKDYGTAVRIKLQAMPYGLSLFTSGALLAWLLLLPFGFFPEAAWGTGLLSVSLMALFMLGLDDLVTQMEDPFDWLPLEPIIATTMRDVPRIVKEVQALKALAAKKEAEGYPAKGLLPQPAANCAA